MLKQILSSVACEKLSLLVALSFVLVIGHSEECYPAETKEKTTQQRAGSKIVIEDYTVRMDRIEIDKARFDLNLQLRNAASIPADIAKIILYSGESKSEGSLVISRLKPGDKRSISFSPRPPLKRAIGSEEIQATINIVDQSAKVVAERTIAIPVPILRIGETIPQLERTQNLSFTLDSWIERRIAVVGPFGGGTFFTYSAKPGMKFIIVFFVLQNNGVRPQETPYFGSLYSSGEIATGQGHIYPKWIYSSGQRRVSSKEEVDTLSCHSGKLLPGELIRGCVVFEIPEVENPIEASISPQMPFLIRFEGY